MEKDIELTVAQQFKNALKHTSLIVKTEDMWDTSLFKRRFDITIYNRTYPFAIIEIKKNIQSNFNSAKDYVRSGLSITNARFGIITDSVIYYFYDRNDTHSDFIELSFDIIITRLADPSKVKIAKNEIWNIFVNAAEQYLPSNKGLLAFIKNGEFPNKIHFNESSNNYILSDDGNERDSFENVFFNKMFGEFKEAKICRYTSLRTIFESLYNVSLRMSGLIGMNDKSEVNYVEKYLNIDNERLEVIDTPLIKEHHNKITAINNRYITSCTNIKRKDDLTLWRLYADDATGVCLVFDVKKEHLNKYILLQKVKYADENGRHEELDFLKNVIDEIILLTGFKFEFATLRYWKHFFKAHDYAVEDEIRLLIIDNNKLEKIKTDWVMTYTHSIINPVIDFRLNIKSFPIQLRTILLGPKCMEQETNCVQIREMIRRKRNEIREKTYDSNLSNLKVELSKIKHYR